MAHTTHARNAARIEAARSTTDDLYRTIGVLFGERHWTRRVKFLAAWDELIYRGEIESDRRLDECPVDAEQLT